MSERGTKNQDTISMAVVVTSGFNLAATMAFLDPFRAANYLRGFPVADWTILSSDGGLVPSSAGLTIESMSLASYTCIPDIAIVSTSWTPEAFFGPPIDASLRRWVRFGAQLGALDTGAFILAKAGLISGKRVTVHYEHIDSFAEMFPDISITEDLYVFDRDCYTACGGSAGTDLAIQLIRQFRGDALANSVARYIFHDRLRPEATRQLPEDIEPLGPTIPLKLRHAIQEMERHLEEPLSIADLARRTRLSQRQMERLFKEVTGKSPVRYYSDIRLDRGRSLVTQTDLPIREIAFACGFASPEYFSRAYHNRFKASPRLDRIEGRIPFQFRAWPMHQQDGNDEKK